MRNSTVTLLPIRALAMGWLTFARQRTGSDGRAGSGQLKVFLECDPWIEDSIRRALDFVAFVRHAGDADVCVRATPVPARGRARHYRILFAGTGAFEHIEASARVRFPRRLAAADSWPPHDEMRSPFSSAVM